MFSPQGPTFVELLSQGLSSTVVGYDMLAPKFDHTPFYTPRAIIDATMAHVGHQTDALDLCCGTGAGLLALSQRSDRAVGIDFSRGMLAVAERNIARAGADGITLRHGNIFELTDEAAFDVVTCFGAFGHVRPAQEAAFAAIIYRALKPGGRFVFPTAPMPRKLSSAYVLSKTFNAAMHLRNALLRPPFVMFYLTFTEQEAARLLRAHGFVVDISPADLGEPFSAVSIVCATRPQAG